MSKRDLINLLARVKDNPAGKYIGNEANYVLEALDSENRENKDSPWTSRFEDAFSRKLGVKYSIAHNSGTSTLHSCLAAVEVGAGDEVIVPANTVIMCGTAALFQNAVPVYADSSLDTFNIDPADVERKITEKTKAIIVVHMHGLPARVKEIVSIAKNRGIAVIEDCAQCVLGSINGDYAGTIGDLSSFSFETKKHISTGEGGMVCTNSELLAEKVRKHGGLGYKNLTCTSGLKTILPTEFQNPNYKRHDSLGYNYRMPELIAAVGLAQLERVDALIERRRLIAELYMDSLKDCDWLIPQYTPDGYYHSYWTFAVRYTGEHVHGTSWKDFYNTLINNGGDGFYGDLSLAYNEIVMQNKPFWGSLIPKDSNLYPTEFTYKAGACPTSESYQPEIMRFKTNYRDIETAKNKINILSKTISFFS